MRPGGGRRRCPAPRSVPRRAGDHQDIPKASDPLPRSPEMNRRPIASADCASLAALLFAPPGGHVAAGSHDFSRPALYPPLALHPHTLLHWRCRVRQPGSSAIVVSGRLASTAGPPSEPTGCAWAAALRVPTPMTANGAPTKCNALSLPRNTASAQSTLRPPSPRIPLAVSCPHRIGPARAYGSLECTLRLRPAPSPPRYPSSPSLRYCANRPPRCTSRRQPAHPPPPRRLRAGGPRRVAGGGGERLVGPSRQGVDLSDIVDGRLFLVWVPHPFVLLHDNRTARTVMELIHPGGVHSIASMPSLDLLDDVNFSKWVLEYGSDDLHEFLFSYSGRTMFKKKIAKLKLGKFSEALGADFALGPYKTWGHVHLLFFPILQQNHFYLLCVNFKSERPEIIDNSGSTPPTPVKYGDTPENVKFKSIVCENLKTKRMPMKWRDTKNKVDCGVYLMRHMESYVGQGVAKWDCGLTSGDKLQLQRLRLRYMKELCIVDVNAHCTSNMTHVLRFLSGHQKTSLLQIRSNLSGLQWDERVDCCKWEGVRCNDAGFVTTLDLSNEPIDHGFNLSLLLKLKSLSVIKLDGILFYVPFPDFFNEFTNLTVLSLSYCYFSGTVPQKLFQLTKLAHLDLAWNHFSGPIPSFNLSNNLTLVDLSNNQFAGEIPFSHWDGLHNLEKLYLNNNSFSGPIPASLFSLPSLQTLYLFMNKFSGRIIDLQKNVSSPLRDLDLGSNNLEGPIPSFLFQLQNLSSLSISSNKFSGTVQLAKFKNLESTDSTLDLSYNNLAIETNLSEAELPFFPQLLFLSLASCNLQQIPDFLKNQSRLAMLDLSSNNMSGEIPNWVWGISDGFVRYLNLSHNRFTHLQEPMDYGRHDYLDLHSNLLSGKIPPLPGSAAYLDLSNNHFSSTIPLDIGSNNFSGILPANLFLELKAIVVDQNEAKTEVDYLHFTSDIGNVYYADSISLSLKGHEGYKLDKILSIFTSIDFSNNQFQGNIPESVGELKLLHLLNISHNALTGNIPPSLENLKALEALDLSFNSLTGNIPDQLVSLTLLSFINLSHNQLVGMIPQGKQFNTFGESSFEENKGLCGFPLHVSCSGDKEPASPVLPELEEEESSYYAEIYTGIGLGFVGGVGGIFVPLLLSRKWRSYYNKKIDGILSKILFQRDCGRTRFRSKSI
nr:receptor-like protein 12 [Ipomoea batatas]